jgi:isocitrate dehydrogenase
VSYNYQNIKPPKGDKISIQNGVLKVPDHPVIPFIEGDGTGPDIWKASVRVFDAAVEKAYGGQEKNLLVRGLRGPDSF